MKLFPYQNDAVDKIVGSRRPLYNAFEAGLGKSATAIQALRVLRARRVLIACPMTALYAWRRELGKFWPGSPPVIIVKTWTQAKTLPAEGIFLLSYGLLSRSPAIVLALEAGAPMHASVIDEAHFVKSMSAIRTRALLVDLRKTLGRAIPMSATPMPNHAGELWPVLRALRPDLIPSAITPNAPMRQNEFEDRYCEKKILVLKDRQVETIVGSKNVQELRDKLRGFFIRETKARVLKELPPMRFDVLPIEVKNPERFQTVGQLLENDIDDDDLLEAAAQMANATRYAELGLAKAPVAAEYIRDMLEGGVGQVAVWAVHHKVIDHLQTALADFGVSRVDGRVASKSRDIAIETFVQGRNRVWVGQIQAGGTAITLSGGAKECRDAIFVETAFSPGDNLQAASRIHRIGQRHGVLVRFVSAADTYDERIEEILARKAADAAELLEENDADVA